MAVSIATAGLALSAAGTATGLVSGLQQKRISRKREALRRRQLQLQMQRERRNEIRQSMLARGRGLNQAAAASGGGVTGSSIFNGISANTTGIAAGNIGQLNQSEELSNQMFRLNEQQASNQQLGQLGGGLSTLGNTMMGNAVTLGRMTQRYPMTNNLQQGSQQVNPWTTTVYPNIWT